MKIDSITLSIFELPSNTGHFDLVEELHGERTTPTDRPAR